MSSVLFTVNFQITNGSDNFIRINKVATISNHKVAQELITIMSLKCTHKMAECEDEMGHVSQLSSVSTTVPAEELARICPDCPSLMPLHDPQGLESVHKAVKKFNEEKKHDKHFRLMEIGRMSSQVRHPCSQVFS